jgi:hypothetical protein
VGVHAHAAPAGLVIHLDATGTGTEIVEGVFGVDAARQRPAKSDSAPDQCR